MSLSAGTLITTNNATYISPRFMPGYRGYCPTAKLDFGQTYGNHTCRYFQDYRNTVLNSSSSNYSSGGSFPTYYTHNPDLVLSCRTRNQDRFRLSPNYQLSNLDHDRNEQLNSLHSLSAKHREHYNDKSGTMGRVDFFQLPVPAEKFHCRNIMGNGSTVKKPERTELFDCNDIFKNKYGLTLEHEYRRRCKYQYMNQGRKPNQPTLF